MLTIGGNPGVDVPPRDPQTKKAPNFGPNS